MNCYVYIVFKPWRLQGLCYGVSLKLGILGKLKEIRWWIVMDKFAAQMKLYSRRVAMLTVC